VTAGAARIGHKRKKGGRCAPMRCRMRRSRAACQCRSWRRCRGHTRGTSDPWVRRWCRRVQRVESVQYVSALITHLNEQRRKGLFDTGAVGPQASAKAVETSVRLQASALGRTDRSTAPTKDSVSHVKVTCHAVSTRDASGV
jgi:hypothetical protein